MGIFSFAFSVLISILVVYLTFRLFFRLFSLADLDSIAGGNVAVAVAAIGNMIAFGILMMRSLYPVSAVLQDLFITTQLTAQNILKTLAYILAYIVIAYCFSVITVVISSKLFQKLTTSIEEADLIKKGNVAVAIMLSGIVITIAIMVQSGLGDLMNTLIPHVDVEMIRVK